MKVVGRTIWTRCCWRMPLLCCCIHLCTLPASDARACAQKKKIHNLSRGAGAAQHILDPLLAAVEGELPSLRRSGAAGASAGHLSKVGIRVLGLDSKFPA